MTFPPIVVTSTPGSGTVRDELKYTYDDWAAISGSFVSLIEQDVDSAVGGSSGNGDYEVSYSWAKAIGGRNTIRPDTMTIPGSLTIAFGYTGGMVGPYDDAASRVGKLTVGGARVAMYDYLGVGRVVGTEYLEPDVFSYRYSGSPASYDGDLDRFNRVVIDDWTKDLADPTPGDKAFYTTAISYDRNGNITVADEAAPHNGVDVQYTIDGVNRLTKAEEGTWNGSAITSRSRQQLWTLTQTGNWSLDRIDLNGDNDFADPGNGDVDDSRTHNEANELTDRDLDTDGDGYDDAHYDLTYDAPGNLTDDGAQYEYVHDVWGRLRKVKNTSTQALIEEYWYYGNGWRKTMHYDTTGNSVVDGSDQKYHFVYDQQWRNVATFRGSDANPKEQFIYNASAGSRLDDVFLRNRDMTNGWTGAADGTLEQLRYMCGNWRGDVVAVLTDTGTQVEQVRYSAYGVPFGRYAGDADSDGDLDAADATQIQTWINAPAYDVRGDLDLDGDVDAADKTACQSNNGSNLGRGKLSLSAVGNRKGYGGYEADIALEPLMHVRHRVLHTTLGRWTRRDPIGYVDGPNLYGYARENPVVGIDPMGTDCRKGGATGDGNRVSCTPVGNPPGGGYQLQPMPIFAHPIVGDPGSGPPPPPPPPCQVLQPHPHVIPHPNGCGPAWAPVPDEPYQGISFKSCCDTHDMCYANCNTPKAQCDWDFLQCMLDACAAPGPPHPDCVEWAVNYFNAVMLFGQGSFDAARAEYCICCDRPNPHPLCDWWLEPNIPEINNLPTYPKPSFLPPLPSPLPVMPWDN